MNAAAEEKKIGRAEKFAGQFLIVSIMRKYRFELARNPNSSCTRQREVASSNFPRTCARYMARMNSAVNWQVNAFVEATPISGPA